MKQKRYWLRGLYFGITIYAIALAIVGVDSSGNDSGNTWLVFAGMYFLPIIFVGLLIGWLYGKIKNRNKTMEIVS